MEFFGLNILQLIHSQFKVTNKISFEILLSKCRLIVPNMYYVTNQYNVYAKISWPPGKKTAGKYRTHKHET